MTFSTVQIMLLVTAMAVSVWACSLIAEKAGYPRWWGLGILLPPVNLLIVWYFAFSEWPGAQPGNAGLAQKAEPEHETTEMLLVRETQRTIENIRTTVPAESQRWIAERVSHAIDSVKSADRPVPGRPDMVALTNLLSRATQEREAALAAGSSDGQNLEWFTAALIESWAGANMAAVRRKISPDTFEGIDAAIAQFVSNVTGP